MPSYVKRMSVHSVICVPRPTAYWPYSTLMFLTSNLHLSMCCLKPRHHCWFEHIRCRREAVLCVQVHSRVHSRGCRVDPPKSPTYNETSEGPSSPSLQPTHSNISLPSHYGCQHCSTRWYRFRCDRCKGCCEYLSIESNHHALS